MTKNSFYLLLLISVLFTSCIPMKDLVYLQDKSSSSEQTNIAAVEAKPYRLQVNDVLSINIKAIDPKLVAIFNTTSNQNDQSVQSESALYFNGFTVDDHGNIRIPILGEMNVIGYTVEEVRLRIEKKLLEEYFKSEANLFVTVKLAGLRYTINGEVGSTGTKVIFKDNVTILEAIANSGDITTVGNRKEVSVIRQTPTGVQMHNIDLTDVNVMKSPYYYLQPNDYIYVKPLRQKTWGTGQTGIQSIGTIITLLSLATTVYLIIKN
ncbi:polysaccharide biosynthesis/export family protein [Flavobacterium sp. 17A]|uniref:Polysaccharide biosynthesis/export family protein n=1 Tax=Flavobacterium potami TaxID=2872310 RepID=A0A9X1KRG1_9FLAO|nr:polysaccharide biosynthesis/export family protein [Flavobacterium potami]MBZ4036520.1 polysaccharide biosynthesis/export family protein [Flavobacterium potami]